MDATDTTKKDWREKVSLLDEKIGKYALSIFLPHYEGLKIKAQVVWPEGKSRVVLDREYEAIVEEDGEFVLRPSRETTWGGDHFEPNRDPTHEEERDCLNEIDLDEIVSNRSRTLMLWALAWRHAAVLEGKVLAWREKEAELARIEEDLAAQKKRLDEQEVDVLTAGRKEGVTGEPEEKIQTTIGALRISAARTEGRLFFVTGPNEKTAEDKGLSFYSVLERTLVHADGRAADRHDYLRFQGSLSEEQGRAYIALAIDEYLRKRPTAFLEIAAIETRMEIAKSNRNRAWADSRLDEARGAMEEAISSYHAVVTAAAEVMEASELPTIQYPVGYEPPTAAAFSP